MLQYAMETYSTTEDQDTCSIDRNPPVDYNNGELTNWVRIELTKAGEPVIHSFPASPEQVQKYMGKTK
jgi:hypothetical protein